MPKALHIEAFDSIINAFRLFLVIGDTPTKISNDPENFLGTKTVMQKEFSRVAQDLNY